MSQLDELREIIVGDNLDRIDALKERIENVEQRTQDVAEVLAPAISKDLEKNDRLISALKTPVSEGLKQAVRAEPQAYAEILYPAISPSIRQAISHAISSMVKTINQTVESATTAGGLRARYESLKSGVPYAEILLRRSLIYRVERLYLIERESGLLIGECGNEDGGRLDSDTVGAMFSAIQSFVQDSFSGDDSSNLTDFKVGSYTVWIAHGPRAMLACVFWGNAPESLKSQLYDTLDLIRTDYAEPLSKFDGDVSRFVGLEAYLQPLLRVKLRSKRRTNRETTLGIGSKILYFGLALLILYGAFLEFEKRNDIAVVNKFLEETPGIVVTNTYWDGGKIIVEGLRDPDATVPLKLLDAYGLADTVVSLQMTPFRSLDMEMELRRFRNELVLPKEVKLTTSKDSLSLIGMAPLEWLIENNERLRQLYADKRLNLNHLYASEASVQPYLLRNLGIPFKNSSGTAGLLSTTAWVHISFNELLQQLQLESNR